MIALDKAQRRFSISLFLKLYSITIVSIFCIGLLLDFILAGLQNSNQSNHQHEALIYHLAQRLAILRERLPDQEIEEVDLVEVISRENTSLSEALLGTMAELGGIQLEDDSGQQYLLVAGSQTPTELLKITLPDVRSEKTDQIITFIYYALLSLVLTLLFLPLSRDLSLLRKSVNAIGQHRRHQVIPAEEFSWLKEFTDIYNNMVERVQLLLENQKELTYSISHELRTPLSRLKFSLALIDNNQPSFIESQASMQQDINDLEVLITELLDYAKFDHDDLPIHLTRVSVAIWLEDVVNCMAGDLKKVRCSFACADHCRELSAIMDPTLTQRAIRNIIFNADKYAVSEIRISLQCDSESWCIHFDDDGPGIPKAQRSIIFDAFKQLKKAPERTKPGWGVGLAISKRIMQRQKGEIKVSDSHLGGARFSLIFKQAGFS